MSKYTYRIMHLPIQRYLKWWLDKQAEGREQVFIGKSETNPAYLTDCLKRAFLKFIIKGKTEQGENPSPDNPQEIENVEGNNIYDLKKHLTDNDVTYIENTDGSLTFNIVRALYNNAFQFSEEDITVSLQGLITNNTSTGVRIELLNKAGDILTYINENNPKKENFLGCKLRFNWSSGGTITLKNAMINKGSIAKPYVPFNCIQIIKSNKNIFDGELELGIYSGSTGLKISSNNYVRCTNFQPVDELTNYKFSTNGEANALYVYEYRADYSYNQSSAKLINTTQHLTTNEGTVFITFRTYSQTTDTTMKIQMEKGTSISDYIDHQGKIYNFPLEEGQSLAQGDYIDKDGIHQQEIVPFTQEQQTVYNEIINDGTYKGITNILVTANINPDLYIEYQKSKEDE